MRETKAAREARHDFFALGVCAAPDVKVGWWRLQTSFGDDEGLDALWFLKLLLDHGESCTRLAIGLLSCGCHGLVLEDERTRSENVAFEAEVKELAADGLGDFGGEDVSSGLEGTHELIGCRNALVVCDEAFALQYGLAIEEEFDLLVVVEV